jgi:CheY-like chemotaxis protein
MNEQHSPPTVMVVEDDRDCIYLWERYASTVGYHVVGTSRGEEALTLAQREKPALVILDIMLPGMDGWKVLQSLKTDPTTQDIPVVMCSALDEQARAVLEGADGYLRKPVRLCEFVHCLQSADSANVALTC